MGRDPAELAAHGGVVVGFTLSNLDHGLLVAVHAKEDEAMAESWSPDKPTISFDTHTSDLHSSAKSSLSYGCNVKGGGHSLFHWRMKNVTTRSTRKKKTSKQVITRA